MPPMPRRVAGFAAMIAACLLAGTASGVTAQATAPDAPAASIPRAALPVEIVRSPGGLTAWLVRDPSVPLLSVEIRVRAAGGAADPAGKEGLARFAAALLDEGAGDLDAQAFQRALEDEAIRLQIDAGTDTIQISLRTLVSAAPTAFRLTGLALTRPRFDGDAVERMRRQFIQRAQREQEDPEALSARIWYKAAFGDHPYGRGARGTPETLAGLTLADLRGVLARLGRDRLIIGASGDVSAEELGRLLDLAFADLPASATSAPPPPATPQAPGAVMVLTKPLPQSVMLFGDAGVRRDDPDWYAAALATQILGGGGMSSRLFEEIREKRGLTYGIGANLTLFDAAPLLMGRVASDNAKAAQVLDLLRAEWARMGRAGPSAEELETAKTYLAGSQVLSLDSTSRVAGLLVSLQNDNLPPDFLDRRGAMIAKVTLDDVRRVARRLFDPARLSVVVVGQPSGIAPTRALP